VQGGADELIMFSDYTIRSGVTGYCLDVLGGNPENGIVGFYPCNGTPAQEWAIAGGIVAWEWAFSGYALQVNGGSQTPGTPIGIGPAGPTASQMIWPFGIQVELLSDQDDFSNGDGVCIGAASLEAGAKLWTGDCNGGNLQQWIANFGGTLSAYSNQIWSIHQTAPPPQTQNVDIDTSETGWILTPHETGYLSANLINESNSLCMDVDADAQPPAELDVTTCNGTRAQGWTLFPALYGVP
jgi:hypothetical protein